MGEILIDVTRLLNRALHGRLPTGIDRVNQEYIRYFQRRARALVRFGKRCIHLGHEDSQDIFDALLHEYESTNRLIRWVVGKNYLTQWTGNLHSCVMFNIGHSGLDHPDYATHVHDYSLMPICFLYDLIPITFPEFCKPGVADMHRKRLATMLKISRLIMVSSKATGKLLEDYADTNKLNLPPWEVVPLAPARLPSPAPQRPMDVPYFIVLGTIEPRKNHLLLLHLWRQLVLNYGDSTPRLIVIGQRGWECEQVEDFLDRSELLSGFVIEHEKCSDEDLATWLHHAQALLFPTFAEGYGMPLVEALAMNVPVIASDLPVLREIGGNIPEYLDPIDGSEWQNKIMAYARPDSVARREQCLRIENYKAPTWEDHFQMVDGLIERCIIH